MTRCQVFPQEMAGRVTEGRLRGRPRGPGPTVSADFTRLPTLTETQFVHLENGESTDSSFLKGKVRPSKPMSKLQSEKEVEPLIFSSERSVRHQGQARWYPSFTVCSH